MTLKRIAALAEVSVKTASRALTGDPAVRGVTRATVMAAAEVPRSVWRWSSGPTR